MSAMTCRRILALLVIPLLLAVSSCVRLQADYEILGDNKVQVAIDFGARNDVVAELGDDVPDFCDQEGLMDPEGVDKEAYAEDGEDGYAGCRLTGTTTVSELNQSGTSLMLGDDGTWTFLMEGNDSMEGSTMTADMFSDFLIRVTFPGEVLTHNGSSTLEGTTVTWSDPADLLTKEGLRATAENSAPRAAVPWLAITVVVAALLIGGGAVLLLNRFRRPSSEGAQGQGSSHGTPTTHP